MTSDNYAKARSYCYKLNKDLYRDVLHDAYVHWFEKTNKDLFDEPLPRVIRVIKLTWFGYYVTKRKVVNRNVFSSYNDNLSNNETPEAILISKELEESFIASCPKLQLDVYLLAVQGYKAHEIAKILDIYKSHVSYYFKKIRTWVAHFN